MEKNPNFIEFSQKSKIPAIISVFAGLFLVISLVTFYFLGNFSSNLAYVSYYQKGFAGFAQFHLSCLTENIIHFPFDFSTGKPFYFIALCAFAVLALGLCAGNIIAFASRRRKCAIAGAVFSIISFLPIALIMCGGDVYFGILFKLEPFTTRSLSLTILDIVILTSYLLTFAFSILSGITSAKECYRVYVPDCVEEILANEETTEVDGVYGTREEEILFERIESGETSMYRPAHESILGYESNRSGPMITSDSLTENEFVEKVDEIPKVGTKSESAEFYEPWEPDGKDEFYNEWESDDEEQIPEEFIEECFKEEFEVDIFQEILDLFNSEGEIEDMNKDEFKSMLREVVRDIVRDELARSNQGQQPAYQPQQPNYGPAPAYGGPLIVQYFNSPMQNQVPVMTKQAPAQPQPAPVQETPKAEEVKAEEPAPVEEIKEEPAPVEETTVEEEAPVVEQPAEGEEESSPSNPIIRIPFTTRMKEADGEMQANYNEIKNEIMAYGVKSRVSNSGDTFRLHRVTYVKLTIAGKSLKLYFALDPRDYVDSTIPVQDASNKAIYKEIPLVFKVKSGLSLRRCKQLIADVMSKNGLTQSEVGAEDWVNKLEESTDDED